MIKKILTTLALSSSILFAANTVEINVNNNTLGLKGEYGINEVYNLSNDAKYYITLEYLSSEEAAATESTDRIVNLGLKMMNPYINDYGVSFGMGINAVWVNNYTDTFVATPLSVFADYAINEDLSIDGTFSYSPKILSYSSADNYTELTAKLNYKVIDNGYAYLGYRDISTSYDDGSDIDFDNSIFFGYRLKF
jgi:hypothetical protein